MRTYTRKRPDYQEIEDVHQLCRLCLGKSQETVPIFTNDSENVCAALALRIMTCVGLQITREDNLPNKICSECYQELERYYRFRKRCEVTYQKLKSHVIAVKEKQYKAQLKYEQNNKNNVKDEDDDGMKFVVKFTRDEQPEVNILTINGVPQHNLSEKLPDESVENNIETEVANEENEELEDDTVLDISTFLTTMLIQIGVFTQQDGGLAVTDESIKSIQLETGDGNLVTMQLTEEDDSIVEDVLETPQVLQTQLALQTPQVLEPPQVLESQPTATEVEADAQKQSDVVIKYITSNYSPPVGGCWKSSTTTNKKIDNDRWCDICDKRLATNSALTRHRRVHSGEKPYLCGDCGRAFSQREVMLRHQLVHTGDRPFKCDMCDKSFTQRGGLLAHARTHAPPHARSLALHSCARCPKMFLHASGLSRHMMVHNGRVYVCGACGRQFRDKSSLLRHMRNSNHAHAQPDT